MCLASHRPHNSPLPIRRLARIEGSPRRNFGAIRTLKPVEVSAVFDADVSAGINGMLYRLKVPAGQRFLHKNTLCGDEDTQWMATYVTGHTLEVAFFSGDDMPVFTFDAISKSPALCGTFAYSR